MKSPAKQLAEALGQAGETPLTYQVAEFLEHAWPADLRWTHFPAGENRGDKIQRTDRRTGKTYWFSPAGAKLKRMGLKPGWGDFQLLLPRGHIGFIELKTEDGDLTPDQEDFRDVCRANGHGWALCRSVDDVERVCARWLAVFDRKLSATVGQPLAPSMREKSGNLQLRSVR